MDANGLTAFRSELDTLVAAHDRVGAVTFTTDAIQAGRITISELYRDVLEPLLVDLGEGWQSKKVAVWQEHYATSIVRTIVESLAPQVAAAAAPHTGRVAILACPTGEQHDLGLRMLADRLTLCGWEAHFLGADTPAAEIIAAAKALGAELVALSAATHYNLVLLRSFVAAIKEGLPNVRIGVGGPAFACDHTWPAEDLLVAQELGIDDDPAGSCAMPGQGD